MSDIDKSEIFAASVILSERFQVMAEAEKPENRVGWKHCEAVAMIVADKFAGTREEYLAAVVERLKVTTCTCGNPEHQPSCAAYLIEIRCRIVEDLMDDDEEPAITMDDYDW